MSILRGALKGAAEAAGEVGGLMMRGAIQEQRDMKIAAIREQYAQRRENSRQAYDEEKWLRQVQETRRQNQEQREFTLERDAANAERESSQVVKVATGANGDVVGYTRGGSQVALGNIETGPVSTLGKVAFDLENMPEDQSATLRSLIDADKAPKDKVMAVDLPLEEGGGQQLVRVPASGGTAQRIDVPSRGQGDSPGEPPVAGAEWDSEQGMWLARNKEGRLFGMKPGGSWMEWTEE